MEKTIVYQSVNYAPQLVTGVYVRCDGRKGKYRFRVFEAATGTGRFAGRPGMGGTLREYDCDGSELPSDLRERCIASKSTELWEYREK